MKKGFLNAPQKKRVRKRLAANKKLLSEPSSSCSDDAAEPLPVPAAISANVSDKSSNSWMKRGFLQRKIPAEKQASDETIDIDSRICAPMPAERSTHSVPAPALKSLKTSGGKLPQTGKVVWKKGFLCNETKGNKNPKKKKIKSKKVLAGKEITHSSLLFLEEKDDENISDRLKERQSVSLLNIVQENTVHDTEAKGASASQKNQNHSVNLILPMTADDEQIESGAFIQERSTKLKRMEEVTTSPKNRLISIVESSSNVIEEVGILSESEGISSVGVPPNHSPSVTLQSELSILLARLNRRRRSQSTQSPAMDDNGDDDVLSSFLDRHLDFNQDDNGNRTSLSNLCFIWDSILEPIAALSKSKKVARLRLQVTDESLGSIPPVLNIACALLNHYPKQSIPILLDICSRCIHGLDKVVDENAMKRIRVQTLGIFIAIRCHICTSHKTLMDGIQNVTDLGQNGTIKNTNDLILTLLERGLPIFQQLVIDARNTGTKKSILVVYAMDTSYCIIEYASLLHQVSLMKGISSSFISKLEPLASCIWHNFSLIADLVQSDKEWNLASSNEQQEDLTRSATILCFRAVLDDWMSTFAAIQNHYDELKLVQNVIEHDACVDAVIKLTEELAGIRLASESQQDKESKQSSLMSYGGIAQTLGKQSSCVTDNEFLELFLPALDAAKDSIFRALEDSSGHESTCGDRSSAILRSVCTWLGQRRKIFQVKDNSAIRAITAQGVEVCISLLRSKSSRCLKFVDAILNSLWSTSGGVPSDFAALDGLQGSSLVTGDVIPPSLCSIMNELKSHGSAMLEADPSQTVLCTLTRRFLLHRPIILIPYFISHVLFNASEVKVLVSLLEKRVMHRQLTSELCLIMEEKLLNILEYNTPLQKILHYTNGIFVSTPLDILIDRLLKILETHEVSSFASSAASKILVDVLVCNALQNSDIIVANIIRFMAKNDTRTDGYERQPRHQSKFLKYVGKWSKVLLISNSCDDQAFASIMSACGRGMLKDPSNSLNLTLFGALIGDGKIEAEESSQESYKRRVQFAVQALVRMSISELERIDKTAIDKSNVFEKLCPLLMLRRIPPHYFRLAHCADSDNPLHYLAQILAKSLGIRSKGPGNTNISSEERRLCADIAANCLPFSASKSDSSEQSSGFEVFCQPIMSSSLLNGQSLTNVDWKALKVALYIGCHIVQVAPETVGCTEYSYLVNFAMTLLNIQDGETEESIESLVEAQTGCIEFLATCICAIHQFPSDAIAGANKPSSGLIEEIDPNDPISATKQTHQTELHTTVAYLSSFRDAIINLVYGNELKRLSSSSSNHCISPTDHQDWMRKKWPVSSRICLLNALSIAMQRCNIDILPKLTKSLVPAIQAWLLEGKIGDTIRHPLCVAAALQCIFNSLQRTKSFAPLEQSQVLVEDSVRKLFEVSVYIIERHPAQAQHQSDAYEQTSMRVAALKLLVVIVSINQQTLIPAADTGDNIGSGLREDCIPPSDLVRAMSIIRGLANMDENPDVRKLATQLLSFMGTNMY